ncbi:MAG: Mu-like prophage major head subunit gpT family protein [Desulfobulbaceae bacterium]|nr:Mu-like prophage major head subunit gpT family protein [Desulfobulbaceae bacterium]
MIINSANLAILFRAFNAAFQRGFTGVTPLWNKVATMVPSTTGTEDYGWLGQIPGMREWIGDRHIHNLKQHDYSIKNKKFELTVGVPEEKVDDDQYGVYAPMMETLGQSANEHPDQLIFALLAAGFSTLCYDGQYFFDTDHPVLQEDGTEASVSNMQAGAGNPWFLLDTRRPLKPLILQMRKKPNFVRKDRPEDDNVFTRGELIYGVDDRKNVGFGFWQMALGSKDTLDATNFDLAMAAMGAFKGDHGKPLGVMPNLLVCGPSNRAKAKAVVEAERLASGASNTNFKAVDVLVVPWLA